MNIEQIAQEVARGMYFEGIGRGTAEYPAEFLRRCLSKLAEQDVDPVGWLCNGELYEVQQYRLFPRDEPVQGQEKLYTETQLLAAQQRTAEACAKAVFEQAKYFGYNVHAEAERDAALNNWREYL